MTVTDRRRLPRRIPTAGKSVTGQRLSTRSEKPAAFAWLDAPPSVIDELIRRAHERDQLLARTSPEYRRIVAAAEAGEHCATCGHVFAPHEPAYFERVPTPARAILRDRVIYMKAVICGACVRGQYGSAFTAYCVCGREVWYRGTRYRSGLCCTRCARRAMADAKRAKRARTPRDQTHTICGHCGSAFTSPRSDARYCSSACRQASYRQRKAHT